MNVESLLLNVDSARERPDLSLETDMAISEALDAIETDLDYIRRDDGFEAHTEDLLKQRQSDDVRVCGCAHPFCPPKHGDLPHSLRDAENFEDALKEYRMSHGNPDWVRDCHESWRGRKRRVKRALNKCIIAARNDEPSVLDEVMEDGGE